MASSALGDFPARVMALLTVLAGTASGPVVVRKCHVFSAGCDVIFSRNGHLFSPVPLPTGPESADVWVCCLWGEPGGAGAHHVLLCPDSSEAASCLLPDLQPGWGLASLLLSRETRCFHRRDWMYPRSGGFLRVLYLQILPRIGAFVSGSQITRPF